MTNALSSVPPPPPMCPPTDEGARDTRALVHLLLAAGVVWAVAAAWRRIRARGAPPHRRRGRLSGPARSDGPESGAT